MSKGLGFVIFVFLTLAALDFLFSAAGGVLPVLSNNPTSAPTIARGQTELASIDFSLFAKNGTGQNNVTQGYGITPYSYRYPNNWHDGVDIAAIYGATIFSPSNGVVIATGNQDDYCYHRGFGKYIAVKDGNKNLILWYAHLGNILISSGQSVEKGTALGTIGATGLETGPHLHLSIFDANGFSMEVRNSCGPEPTGRDLNPFDYLGTTYQ